MNRALPLTPAEALRSVTRKSRPGALVQAAGGTLALHGVVVGLLWSFPMASPATVEPPSTAVRMTLAAPEPEAAPEPPAVIAPASTPAAEPVALHKRQRPRRSNTRPEPAGAHPAPAATAASDAPEVETGGLPIAPASGPPIDFGSTLTLGDVAPGSEGTTGGSSIAGTRGSGYTPPAADPHAFRCHWPSGLYAQETAKVEAYAEVDAAGHVHEVIIEQAPTSGFRRAAERCVRAVHFRPARSADGHPRAGRSPRIRLHFVRGS